MPDFSFRIKGLQDILDLLELL
ncbi:hypothetical protein VCRA2123O443_200058 [Vibrio crassostreae]|nr:hypothetical protein VCRA2110O182_200036 [Vibrio crassostreae]CAK2305912.1 hypothetical protein VCRA2111O408_200059 [Vibrio crassostreae]CAK2322250.1 hypothetical protein VCRA211O406_200035 [Vibrio crassostreae]CAK3225348.1 hypothetical protein VCRA2123O443_200058 [Vibrio crassostreae]